jgi:uncharacterized RDD family membrane protein YckC
LALEGRVKEKPHLPWEPEGKLVTLETPEQIGMERRIASLGERIAAVTLDSLLLFGISVVLILGTFIVAMAILGVGFERATDAALGAAHYWVAVLTLANFLLWTFYYTYCEVRMEGRTYGKKAVGIRTIVATGQGVTLSASLIRNLARGVDHIPFFVIVPMLDPLNRRIGDLLAGTLVVHAPTVARRPPPIAARRIIEPSQRKFFFSAQVEAMLVPDDLNLLEHFFRRLPSIPNRVQRNLFLASFARRYQERLGMDAERVKTYPREFLQELYHHLREKFDKPLL